MSKRARTIAAILVVLLLIPIGIRFFFIFRGSGSAGGGGGGRGGGKGGGKPVVAVEKLAERVIQMDYELAGSVESSQNVDIVAKTQGPIIELPVRQGDPVKKGQVLAKIDAGQARANLLKKKSDLANARFTYYQQLAQRELTSVQATSGVQIAQADLSAARSDLDKTRSVYHATLTQGKTSVVQAQAKLVGAQAALRQAQSDFTKSKAKYERMLELGRQGFASNADLQDAYQDVLAQNAAVDQQKANIRIAQVDITNAQALARKDATSARSDIQTSVFTETSKQATLNEARAGTSKTQAFQQQLLAQQSLVEAAEADFQTAELQLSDTVLVSPVNGYVSDRKLDVGALASVGTKILTVQSGGQVWVVAPMPQEVYNRVEVGRPCVVMVDGVRNRQFPGKVFAIDPAIDAASRQFNVRITFDNREKLVKPGMFARVQVKVGDNKPHLTVPNSALVDRDPDKRGAVVYKVTGDKVTRVRVALGFSDSKYTRVREGLAVGDTVVVQTANPLKDGQVVQPKPVEALPRPAESP